MNAFPSNASMSHELLTSNTRVSGKRWAAVVFAALIITAGLVWGVSKLARRKQPAQTSTTRFQTIELTRLTNSGKVTDAAISIDGKYVAYVAEQDGMESIWLRDIASSHDTQVVPPADITYYGGTFSRDGNDLYYIAMERTNSIGVLHRVPVRGGAPVKLIVDVDGPVSLSPDNKQIAFVRGSSTGERALMISNADGGAERKLASRTGYDAFTFNGPAWSPDGLSIACGAAYSAQTGRSVNLVAVSVADGSIRELAANNWKTLGRISWLQDGSGLVFTAPTDSSAFQLWFLPYPTGKPQRITRDLQDYHGVSVTGDSRILVAKQTQTISNLAIAPKDHTDLAKSIFSHKVDANYDPYYYSNTRFSWASNGKIVYTSVVNGSPNIWTMNTQGTDKEQLTHDPGENTFPSMTPDGRHIIFISNRTGFSNVWRMDTDGSNQTRLTSGEEESWAWCSPDNRWVIYHSGNQGKRTLWRVPVEGGTPEQLTDYPSVCPAVSPDGKWILFYYRIEPKVPWKVAIVPVSGGHPIKTLDVPHGVEFRSLIRWTPDGLSIAYIANRDGVSNIWVQPLEGQPARKLTNFTSDKILWFDWSPDGQQFGVTRGAVTSDVVMIKDLQRISQ
jgi:Tol biopolymer transport system component